MRLYAGLSFIVMSVAGWLPQGAMCSRADACEPTQRAGVPTSYLAPVPIERAYPVAQVAASVPSQVASPTVVRAGASYAPPSLLADSAVPYRVHYAPAAVNPSGVVSSQTPLISPSPVARPIVTGTTYQVPQYQVPHQVYRPIVPASRVPQGVYYGRGIIGQPKLYISGQPVRNVLRYLTP